MCFKGRRLLTSALFLFLSNSSCIQKRNTNSGSGLSAVVDIIGMEQGDEDLEGIAYTLICNQGAVNEYKVVGTAKKGTKSVEFPDNQLKVGDSCGMDITATQKTVRGTQDTFKWLASKGGNLIAGLFYSSNFAPVEMYRDGNKAFKYLKLALHKVYGLDYRDAFEIDVQLMFEREEGAIIPQSSGVLTNLHCYPKNQNDDSRRFQEATLAMKTVTGKPEDRKFSFRLSAAKMQNVLCDRVTVSIDNIFLYEGSLTKVEFINPKMGENPRTNAAYKFGPFSVRSVQESYGAVKCVKNLQDSSCVAVQFDQNAPIWFAHVRVVNSTDNATQDMIVTSIQGLVPDTQGNIMDLSGELGSYAGRFKFYLITVRDDILEGSFEPSSLQAAMVAQEISADQVKNARVTQIANIYTHGFKTVSEGSLNDLNNARWFAVVTALSGKEQKRMIVGGGHKYFASQKKPAGTMFFLPEHYRANLTGSNEGYRTYALKGEALDQSCNVTLDGYRNDLGQLSLSGISAGNNADVNQCEITDTNKLSFLKNSSWVLSPRYYLWAWHKTSM